jgi:uncharacterized protein (TIGR00269 family)
MADPDDRILIAVSGGKDSLALWHVLIESGYQAAGLHIDLGIGAYSERSSEKVEAFANQYRQKLYLYRLKEAHQMGIVELSAECARSPCSACGTIKRYHFNRFARENGYNVLATGHNLDDEAARLLGNVLRWHQDYLDKQSPVLAGDEKGFVKKIKPLFRFSEYEVAAYSFLNRIDYVVEECPMSLTSPMLIYKKALNLIENHSPGAKHQFYLSFLESRDQNHSVSSGDGMRFCSVCGEPTTAVSSVCGYCKITQPVSKVQGTDREKAV